MILYPVGVKENIAELIVYPLRGNDYMIYLYPTILKPLRGNVETFLKFLFFWYNLSEYQLVGKTWVYEFALVA